MSTFSSHGLHSFSSTCLYRIVITSVCVFSVKFMLLFFLHLCPWEPHTVLFTHLLYMHRSRIVVLIKTKVNSCCNSHANRGTLLCVVWLWNKTQLQAFCIHSCRVFLPLRVMPCDVLSRDVNKSKNWRVKGSDNRRQSNLRARQWRGDAPGAQSWSRTNLR